MLKTLVLSLTLICIGLFSTSISAEDLTPPEVPSTPGGRVAAEPEEPAPLGAAPDREELAPPAFPSPPRAEGNTGS